MVAMCTVLIIVVGEGRLLKGLHLSHIMDSAQIANLALSLLANVFATSIIAVKAWCVPSRWLYRSIILLTAP